MSLIGVYAAASHKKPPTPILTKIPGGPSAAYGGFSAVGKKFLSYVNLLEGEVSPGLALISLQTILRRVLENDSWLSIFKFDEDVVADLTRFTAIGEVLTEPAEHTWNALWEQREILRALVAEWRVQLSSDSVDVLTALERHAESLKGLRKVGLPEPSSEVAVTLNKQHRHAAESVARIFYGALERAGISQKRIPDAISLDDVFEHPEKYRDRVLEIVLFDVDGTTHSGQYWLGWLIDVLQYWPTPGIPLRKVLLGLIDGVGLLLKEKKGEYGDSEQAKEAFEKAVNEAIGRHLKGVDGKKIQESMDRFYDVKGRRNLSDFMKREFVYHRANSCVIVGLSASQQYLVRRHAKDIGIPPENVFGTEVKSDENGRLTGEFYAMRSGNKVKYLQERILKRLDELGIRYRLIAAYSDSDSDYPMFERVIKDGGLVTATNAPHKSVDRHTLRALRGRAVHERHDWPNDGVRRTVVFDSEEAGRLVHERPIPPRRPPTYDVVRHYSNHSARSLAAFFFPGIATIMGAQALLDGIDAIDLWEALTTGVSIALGGAVGSTATHVFVPKTGTITESRKWLLEQTVPVVSAMTFAGVTLNVQNIPYLPWLAATVGVVGVIAGAGNLISRGFRALARGLGWKKVDRYADSFGGETLMRATQLPAYYALVHWLNRFFV